MKKFAFNARQQNGEEYKESTLKTIWNSVATADPRTDLPVSKAKNLDLR